MVKKYLTLFLALILAALGISLTMKAAVGVSAFDAVTQTLSLASGIRVGDMLMIIYVLFIAFQFVLLKKEADWTILLQLPLTIILGQFINLFFYDLLGNLSIDFYFLNVLLFLFAQVLVTFSIAMILLLDLISMPIERFSLLLAERKGYSFGRVRQSFDLLFLLISISLTLVLKLPFTIREGTIVSALIFGPMMAFFLNKLEKPFKEFDLI